MKDQETRHKDQTIIVRIERIWTWSINNTLQKDKTKQEKSK